MRTSPIGEVTVSPSVYDQTVERDLPVRGLPTVLDGHDYLSHHRVKVVALFNGNVREIKEVLFELEEPFVVDSSAFESAFDQRATPLEEAIPATVEWFRANPQ